MWVDDDEFLFIVDKFWNFNIFDSRMFRVVMKLKKFKIVLKVMYYNRYSKIIESLSLLEGVV